MKKLLPLLLFFPVFAMAQKHKDSTGILPYSDGKIHVTGIITLDSAYDKSTLYDNAVIWFGKSTNDYNNKLQHKDKYGLKDNIIINNRNEGEFVGILNILVSQAFNQILIGFDAYVYAKDGKYKYDFTNYKYLRNLMIGSDVDMVDNLEGFDRKGNKNLMAMIYKNSLVLSESLKKQMETKKPTKDF